MAFSPRLLNANQHNSITDKIEGADKEYTGTYGVTTKADKISLQFVTEGLYTTNVGSRLYMMDNDDTNYKMFHMKHREFTFTVDDADIDCGSMGPCTSYKWTMMVARASTPSTVTWLVLSCLRLHTQLAC